MTVWRYLDFAKFVSLLDSRALFFARVDLVGDSFEGSFPRQNRELGPEMRQMRKGLTECTFVNCWHLSADESVAMWQLYARSQYGVAIKSTYKQLVKCLPEHKPPILAGVVRYMDYDTGEIPDDNTIHAFMHKRLSYQHEQEVRVLIQDLAAMTMFGRRVPAFGFPIEVDMVELINEVSLSPGQPPWFFELITSVIKKYDLELAVVRSRLDDHPSFT